MWFCGTTSISCILETILWPIYEKLFSVWFKEHCELDKPTGVGDHCNATGHSVFMDNLKVLDREQDGMKEVIHIKQRAPSMNRDQGYQLPPIYGRIIPRPPSEPPPPPPHDHCVIKIFWRQVETSQCFTIVSKWVNYNHFLYVSWNQE